MADERVLSLTPQLKTKALALMAPFERGPLYTPLSLGGAVLSPGISGGANWPGGAFDPETGILYVTAVNDALLRSMVPDDNFYGYKFRQHASRVDGLPLVNPPWGTLTAINLNTGSIAWQVANGRGPKNNPAIASLSLPDLGTLSKSNAMVTARLVFAATSADTVNGPPPDISRIHTAPGFDRSRLQALGFNQHATVRAFDKATGKIVWEHPIGPSFNDGGAPMTYSWKGRQYLVLPVGGATDTTHMIAFALAEKRKPS